MLRVQALREPRELEQQEQLAPQGPPVRLLVQRVRLAQLDRLALPLLLPVLRAQLARPALSRLLLARLVELARLVPPH